MRLSYLKSGLALLQERGVGSVGDGTGERKVGEKRILCGKSRREKNKDN